MHYEVQQILRLHLFNILATFYFVFHDLYFLHSHWWTLNTINLWLTIKHEKWWAEFSKYFICGITAKICLAELCSKWPRIDFLVEYRVHLREIITINKLFHLLLYLFYILKTKNKDRCKFKKKKKQKNNNVKVSKQKPTFTITVVLPVWIPVRFHKT